MLAFTKRTDYALLALACLAEERGRDGEETISARRIAERYGMPLPLLMNVLKDLGAGGLIRSARGAHGGYALAGSPSEITVHAVVGAIEGPAKLAACCGEDEDVLCQECNIVVKCPVTRSVRRLNDRVQSLLSQVTLADLMNENLQESHE